MNVMDVLRYGHRTVVRTVEAFPGEAWYTPGAVGTWTAKDVIAHLASFEWMLVDLLGELLEPGIETPVLDQYRATDADFNTEQVAQRTTRSLDEVLTDYMAAHAQAMALAADITPQMWEQEGLLPWYGEEYDLEDFVTYTSYGHKREHCGQIAVFGDRFTRPGQ